MARFQKVVIGGATLYHGDCMAVLPHLPSVDILVTSPPYNTLPTDPTGSGMHRGDSWIKKAANSYEDRLPEPTYQIWLRAVFDLCRPKVKGLVWINHKVRYRAREAIHPIRLFPYPLFAEIIWNRRGSMTLGAKRFAPSHEGFYGFGVPHYWNDMHNTKMTVWDMGPGHDLLHPCPFPAKLIEPLIIASCPLRGTVLDPFMGVGTTGVVCTNHGRKFIGIEKEKKFFARACALIEKAHKQTLRGEPLQAAVLDYLNGGTHSYTEIAKEFSLDKNAIYKVITTLVAAKLIKKLPTGQYKRKS